MGKIVVMSDVCTIYKIQFIKSCCGHSIYSLFLANERGTIIPTMTYLIQHVSNDVVIGDNFKPLDANPLHIKIDQPLPVLWTFRYHRFCSNTTYKVIKTILMLSLVKDNRPKFNECLFYLMPTEILLYIFEYLPLI